MIRLVNLVELLLDTKRPLTQEEIQNLLEGMPEGEAARRQVFERAKAELKRSGIPIRTVPVDVAGHAGYGYMIDPSDMVLDIDLDDEERTALGSALASVSFGGQQPTDLAGRLGFVLEAGAPVFVDIPNPTDLPIIYEAAAESKLLRINYLGVLRDVETYRVVFRWGAWYLVGFDHTRGAVRVFRVDRIQGPIQALDGSSYGIPDDFDLDDVFPAEQWMLQLEEEVAVKIRADVNDSKVLRSRLAKEPVEVFTDGSSQFEIASSNPSSVLSLLFELGGRLSIDSPPSLIRLVRDWLLETLAGHKEGPLVAWPDLDKLERFNAAPVPSSTAHSRGPAMRNAGERFSLLCSILPFLQKQKRLSITYLSERFNIDRGKLIGLLEAAATCGLPPYTPDRLFELIVDPESDEVIVNVESALALPQRLDYASVLALFAASQSVMAAIGGSNSPQLRSALEKLTKAIKDRGAADDLLTIEMDGSDRLEVIGDAISSGGLLKMTYNSQSSGRLSDRLVEPLRLFSQDGNWYAEAFDPEIGEVRIFRVSRMLNVAQSGPVTTSGVHSKQDREAVALRLPDRFETVTLELDEVGLRKMDEIARGYYHPVANLDSRWLVRLPVVSNLWLYNTLCSLGPNARIVGDPSWKLEFFGFAEGIMARHNRLENSE